MSIRFDMINERDRHTDIQKDGWTEVTVFVTVLKLEIPYPLKM